MCAERSARLAFPVVVATEGRTGRYLEIQELPGSLGGWGGRRKRLGCWACASSRTRARRALTARACPLCTTFGSPFEAVTTTKKASRTPRFFQSVSTLIQNFALSPPP